MRRSYLGAVALATALTACSGSGGSPEPGGHSAASADAAALATMAAKHYADWPTYHGGVNRAGLGSMPRASGAPKLVKQIKLDGQVYASPIVVHGMIIVATEHDSVYAFSSSYKKLWKRHLGTPSPQSERPCGNIDPLGITGTPAYDSSTGLVYVAPEFKGGNHALYALHLTSGSVAFHRTLDLPGVAKLAMQERGALAVSKSRVYVPFGGLAGDCAQYKGRVVGYSTKGTGKPVSYTVPTAREAGIWTPPGPTVDSAGNVFVAVGNGASGSSGRYDHSDSVLKLSPTLKLLDSFSPSTWRTDNDNDRDLGSQGPAFVGKYVYTDGKLGTAYTLRRSHLGGIGGQVSKATICHSFGGTAVQGTVVYVPCTDGVRAVRVLSGGSMHVLWQASSSVTGSPVIAGYRIWSLDVGSGRMYALDKNTGTTKGDVYVGAAVSRFATPAVSGPRLIVPTLLGISVLSTS